MNSVLTIDDVCMKIGEPCRGPGVQGDCGGAAQAAHCRLARCSACLIGAMPEVPYVRFVYLNYTYYIIVLKDAYGC